MNNFTRLISPSVDLYLHMVGGAVVVVVRGVGAGVVATRTPRHVTPASSLSREKIQRLNNKALLVV